MRIGELAVLAVVLAACGGGDDDGGGGGADADPGTPDACAAPGEAPAIVFLNRDGGAYTLGAEDSVANVSASIEQDRTVQPHPYGDENGDAIVACCTAGLSPFHIDVVEEDPGDVDHTEVVFTVNEWQPEGVGSFSSFSCAGYPRGIAWVFSDVVPEEDPETTCQLAISQFGSLAAGLEHADACEDFMSQSTCETEKSWVDADLACGDFGVERACDCGGTTQNSFQKMTATFGPSCL